jgi:hypothetical protein
LEVRFVKPIAFFLAICFAFPCYAQDIRSKVRTSTPAEQSSNFIDPDAGIYGVPFGTSEDDFIAKEGKPIGYIRLSPQSTAMIYGKSQAFLFTEGKLVGVRITDSILDWKLSRNMDDQNLQRISGTSPVGPCDINSAPRWRLSNGITNGMDLTAVKKILGSKLSGDEYNRYYDTKTARVELDFARYTDEGDSERAYKVNGILIRKRGSSEAFAHR